jgi:arylsulfatase A
MKTPSLLLRKACVVFMAIFCLSPGPQPARAASPQKPNIILILADDLGWTDLACYGSDFYETPHLDRLAKEGMKFTQAYSACCVCSPTRAAILTGKYPARLHVTDWIPGQPPENPKLLVPDWTKYLPLQEVTLARALKSAGYATASIGKWHLGGEEYFPDKHGFDVNRGGSSAAQPPSYFAPYKIATLPEGPEGEYVTDRLGEEAVRFIEQNKENPFFLYLPHFAVHLPLQGKKDLVKKYEAKLRPGLAQTNAIYAAMIESMDDSVGRIRRKLEELKLADRTIVIFASDNGGRVPTTSNRPLRVGKGSCYEGGTRVPLIVHWPGVTRAGGVCETPVISMDVFPTILEIAHLKNKQIKNVDGLSLAPLLREKGRLKRDTLFWHYPHYQHYQLGGTTPYGAIRAGDFKLIEFFDDMRVELYNLHEDIGEQHNLAAQMPRKVNELRSRLHAWREKVGAQMPSRNPAHDPSRPEHDPSTRKKKESKAAH